MAARRDRGTPRLLRGDPPRAGGQWRARAIRGPRRTRPGQGRHVRWTGRTRRHRRPVPGVQGVAGGLPGRRCRLGGACARDRRASLGRAGTGRHRAPAADPGPAGDGPLPADDGRDGGMAPYRSGRPLTVPADVEGLLRDLAPQVLGVVARRFGDFDAAEDATQEALIAAADHWPRDGVPADPRAWLVTSATRRLIDQRRSEASRVDREIRAATHLEPPVGIPDADDTLVVVFMCCHPALTPASAIALTLRAVGGLTTAQIARAFLVPEATMAQRISRAKATIRVSGAPFAMPSPDERVDRLRSVLQVLYLMFNEGYTTSEGPDLQRVELSAEAIRLMRMLHAALPDEPEVGGLLALMLLTDARRSARTDRNGEPVAMPDQDRGLWDQGLIGEGIALLDASIARGQVGEYQIQAAVAAIHDRSPRPEDTDWPQILALYGLLEQVTASPIVTLNRAVAVAMVHGPEAGLSVVDGVADRLDGNHRVEVVRAHLLEMKGDDVAAVVQYRRAVALATNLPEQRYLSTRAARLRARETGEG